MNFQPDSKVLIQGIAEPLGASHTPLMKAYGTQVVAGVSSGRGREVLHDIPVFDLVEQAVEAVGEIDATLIFSPPYQALDAALEAIAAGIHQIIIITEGMPPLDMIRLVERAEATDTLVVGPNSPGIIVPGQVLLGTYPADLFTPGPVGIISRSSTLTYEVGLVLTRAGLGQSIVVGIGSDSIVGSSFAQWLQILDEDEHTEAIVLVGEVGGESEEIAAQYIKESIDKPVIAYVAGRTAQISKPMGHGATVQRWHQEVIVEAPISDKGLEIGTAASKIAAFKAAKVPVADRPSKIPSLLEKALKPSAAKAG